MKLIFEGKSILSEVFGIAIDMPLSFKLLLFYRFNRLHHKPFFRLSGYTGDKGDPIVVRPVNDIAPVGF